MRLFGGLRDRLSGGSYFDAIILLAESFRAVERDRISEALRACGVSPGPLKLEVQPARAGSLVLASHPEFRLEVMSAGAPYVPGGFAKEQIAEDIRDAPLALAFMKHGSFITCNSGNGCPERLRARTGLVISAVAAALADDWTLMLWNSESNRMILPSDEALELLKAGKREEAFDLVTWSQTINVAHLDLADETEEARRRWPEFVAAIRSAPDKTAFGVKCRFDCDGGEGSEHIWLRPLAVAEDRFKGIVVNKPNRVSWLKRGAVVEVELGNITDWAYTQDGQSYGGFTSAKIEAEDRRRAGG